MTEFKKNLEDSIRQNFDPDNICSMYLEVHQEVFFHKNPTYLCDSFKKSKFFEFLWELLGKECFERHPTRIIMEEWLLDAGKKTVQEKIFENLKSLPGFTQFELKHDDKRSTVYFGINLFASIGQLRQFESSVLQDWVIIVNTPVGKFQIN